MGLLSDVDGTIVETPHEECWRKACEECGVPKGVFTKEFYQKHVAGISGIQGAKNILRELGRYIGKMTPEKFHQLKQRYVERAIERGEFKVYEDALDFVLYFKRMGMGAGAVSSSKNAEKILKKVDVEGKCLYDIFDSHTLGVDIETKEGLYRRGATDLKEVTPEIRYFLVMEDADMGIQGAKEAGMFVVARSLIVEPEHLKRVGADVACYSFDEIDYEEIVERLRKRLEDEGLCF